VDVHDPDAHGTRAVYTAIAVNVVLVLVKCTAGVLGHSSALLADGVESMSDVLSSSMALGALRISSRPPDEQHPYGHGKAEPLVAIGIAGLLLVAATGIAIESIRELVTPQQLPAGFTLIVLALVVVVKTMLSRYTGHVGQATGSTAIGGDAIHHFSDALTSALAFVGISAGLAFHLPQADDWAALFAVPVIVFTALRQVREPLNELLDVAQPAMEEQVRATAAHVPGVHGLDKCFVRKAGRGFYVDLHVVVDSSLTVRAGHDIAHRVQAAVRASNPRIVDVLVHIEPTP
jgi:cation diffusion facilitator family transporter